MNAHFTLHFAQIRQSQLLTEARDRQRLAEARRAARSFVALSLEKLAALRPAPRLERRPSL